MSARRISIGELQKRLMSETDTGLVFVPTVWLEQVLDDVLKTVFIPDAAAFVDKLTGKLDLKVSLVRALGFLSETDLRDLRNITTIRNRFAHRALDGTFDDPDVAPFISDLSVQSDGHRGSALILTVGNIARKLYRGQMYAGMSRNGTITAPEFRAAEAEGFPIEFSEDDTPVLEPPKRDEGPAR